MLQDKNSFDINIKYTSGEEFEIPLEGSLGLLALGDLGLMAWRRKKEEVYNQIKEHQNKEHE